MTRNNHHVKAYLFVRLYGGSKAKARAAVVESFQPFAKTKRRQIGRAIRTGERRVQQFRDKLHGGYRTYEQQKALYERWKARGRGTVATPQLGSHHSRGLAIDIDPLFSEEKRRIDLALRSYGYLMPVADDRMIVSLPENEGV